MSDVMLFGVLRMPMELAMSDEFSRMQFWYRAQEALDRIAELERQNAELVAKLQKVWDALPYLRAASTAGNRREYIDCIQETVRKALVQEDSPKASAAAPHQQSLEG